MNQLTSYKIALAVILGVGTVLSVIFRLNKKGVVSK